MVLFTAYTTAQNLTTLIYRQLGFEHLGEVCIFTIYASLAFGNLLASHFKRTFSIKMSLVCGGICFTSFLLAGLLSTHCGIYKSNSFFCDEGMIIMVNIASAVLLGLGGAFLWLAQANYVNGCSDESNKGIYNGIFWSIMQVSQPLGSVMAAFVLGETDEFTFYIILSVLALISVVMFFFTPRLKTEQNKSTIAEQVTFKNSIKSFFRCLRSPDYRQLIATSFASGIITAFYTTYFLVVIGTTIHSQKTNFINQRTAIVLLSLGCGEVLAGISIGRLADTFSKKGVTNFVYLLAKAALVLTIIAGYLENYELIICAGFMWGYCDTSVQTMVTCIIGAEYEGTSELYAVYRFVEGFATAFGTVLAIIIANEAGTAFAIIIFVILFICNLVFRTGNNLKTELDAENEEMFIH